MRQDHNSRHALHRRSVLRAGAWTVPVVAVAAAVPSAAASSTDTYILIDSDVRIDTAMLLATVSITITDSSGGTIAGDTEFAMTIDGHSTTAHLATVADRGKKFSGYCSLDPTVAYSDYTTRLIIGAWTSDPLNVTVL